MNEILGRAEAGFSVAAFARFWAKPDMSQAGGALAPDVAGWWPGRAEPVRGREAYARPLADLLALVPDFRLEVAEHATEGNVIFIRWIAHGTLAGRPLSFDGVDRIKVRDGQVAENRIVCDHPFIKLIVERMDR